MADRVIMAHTTRLSALFLGLTTAIATLTSVAVAQNVQTRAEAQGMPLELLCCADTSLRAQYPDMVRQSGKILVFGPDGTANAVADRWGRFVLYAPLNRLWLLEDEMDSVVEHAYIVVKQNPFDHLVLHWTHWGDADISDILPAAAQLPIFSVENTTPHPLAAAYDALLSKPLARAFDPLPTGAYFNAGGHVFDASGTQIAKWDSFGSDIALRLIPVETEAEPAAPDSLWQWFSVADLAAALNPKQPSDQGEK